MGASEAQGAVHLFLGEPYQRQQVLQETLHALEAAGPLGKLTFKPYVKSNGQPAIRVSSPDPVREPFLDFLIEVEWPQGKTVKEYTVLLDPPVFTERRGARVRPAEVERAAPPVEAPRREARAARAAAPVAVTGAPPAGGESYGPVHPSVAESL